MELSPIESNLFGIVLELVADVRVSFLFDLGDNSTGDGFNFIVVGALFVIPVSICKAFFFNGPVDAVDDFNAMGLHDLYAAQYVHVLLVRIRRKYMYMYVRSRTTVVVCLGVVDGTYKNSTCTYTY